MTRWNPRTVAECKRLYIEEGKSAAQTARSLGDGCTRHAVVGKAHRMGWMLKGRQDASLPGLIMKAPTVPRARHVGKLGDRFAPKPASQNPFGASDDPVQAAEKRIAQQMAGLAAIQQAVENLGCTAITLMQRRTFQCAWPVGTPERSADQLCCGQPVPANAIRAAPAYCAAHGVKAIAKQQPGEKARANLQARRAA